MKHGPYGRRGRRTVRVAVLAYPGCVPSPVHGALDVFAIANWEHGRRSPGAPPLFEARIVTPKGRPVPALHGRVTGPAMDSGPAADLVIVSPWLGEPEAILRNARSISPWLRHEHARGARVSSACSGSFLLAEAGLLDGLDATTHWFWAARFRERYPKVRLRSEKMLVDEGRIVTAAGMTAYLDLCLYFVAKLGSPELASACSKLLLVDSGRRLQSAYEVFEFEKGHGDEEVLRAQEWVGARFRQPLTLAAMAESAGLGARTFLRRFKRATGDTPLEYVQRLRVDRAKRLLEFTRKSLFEITSACGYEDSSSFHRLFRRRAGLSPGEYRRKHSLLRGFAELTGRRERK